MTDVCVVHERDDTLGEGASPPRVVATDVEVADSTLSQMRGLMFRSELPDALVMEVGNSGGLPFSSKAPLQSVHMLFVRHPLDVVWLVDDKVRRVSRMKPWRSVGVARADRIIELPAGSAEGIEVGDTVTVVDANELDETAKVAQSSGQTQK